MLNIETKLIVDRIEGDFVIVETEVGKFINLPAELFPFPLNEGDIISLIKCEEEIKNAKERVGNKLNRLFKK